MDSMDETSGGLKRQTLKMFDAESLRYATGREQEQLLRSQLEIAMNPIGEEKGLVLDVGCAAGSEFAALRALGFNVVGMDFSAKMLQEARAKFGDDPQVRLCRADMEYLPFPSATFDHIICLGALEYLSD